MSDGYTKLFASITDSTIWQEPDPTRLVWITMLALADQDGYIGASIPGLASRARVSLDDCVAALNTFKEPDKWSRTPDFEGRRIIDTEGGWMLLNHAKYRAIRNADERRERARTAMAKLRSERKLAGVSNVSHGEPPLAHTEAEAEAEVKEKKKATSVADPLLGVNETIARDFRKLRSTQKAPITETAIAGIRREATKAGLSLDDALAMCCERTWRGFKADWINGNAPAPRHRRDL